MNLYEKALLILTPNAYKASKIYAAKPTDGSGDMVVARASAKYRRNVIGVLEALANNVPALHYPVGGGCPAWLMEPQRTNLLKRSIKYTHVDWIKQNSGTTFSLTDNFTTAPDGTNTACKLSYTAMDSAGKYFSVYQAVTVADGNHCFSVWMKGDVGGEKIYIYGPSYGGATLITLTNNWVLYNIVVTTVSGSRTFFIGGEYGVAGMGTIPAGTIYLWNSQLEAGSYSTSDILTTSAAVTRVADATTKSSISSLISQSEGAFFLDFQLPSLAGGSVLAEIANVSNQNINFQSSGSTLFWYSNGGGFSITATIAANTRYKVVGIYKANNVKLFVNGVLVSSTLTAIVHANLSKFSVGCSSIPANHSNVLVYGSALFPLLTDAECIALTTP